MKFLIVHESLRLYKTLCFVFAYHTLYTLNVLFKTEHGCMETYINSNFYKRISSVEVLAYRVSTSLRVDELACR